jgi:hypothetical protein
VAHIVFVFGWPGQGKSTLAKTLVDEAAFRRVDVDDLYVRFIRTEFPQAATADLEQQILGHYDRTFSRDETQRRAWHDHFLAVIVAAAADYAEVVVDGYLLWDCRTAFDGALTKAGHRVLHLRADSFRYTQVAPVDLTAKAVVAALKSSELPV